MEAGLTRGAERQLKWIQPRLPRAHILRCGPTEAPRAKHNNRTLTHTRRAWDYRGAAGACAILIDPFVPISEPPEFDARSHLAA